MLQHDLLQAGQQRGRLARVAAGTHAEVRDRLGKPEVGEEDVGHERVVVLPGVDDALPDPQLGQAAHDGRRLDEVGTSAQHVQNEGIFPH